MKKHLIYHLWPRRDSCWRWNIEQILPALDQMDGVRSIGIAIDQKTDSIEAVKDAFKGHRIDNWIIRANDPNRREATTFFDLLKTLPTDDGITFFAHAKGVQYGQHDAVRQWAEMMYGALLENPTWIESQLQGYTFLGCFKKHTGAEYRSFYQAMPYDWHFSGTFFWFDNQKVFSAKDVYHETKTFQCIELWPSQLVTEDNAVCILGERPGYMYGTKEFSSRKREFDALIAEQKAQRQVAFVTGTNRVNEKPMIDLMIKRAREVGVLYDFHVFAPFEAEGAINHPIPYTRSWNRHMAKLEFLQELGPIDAEYVVWLDTDNYFVRHPGDFSELIRDEPCWVSMESDLTLPYSSPGDPPELSTAKYQEWYGIYLHNRTPSIQELWSKYGGDKGGLFNTNGGMFIVRTSAIQEFHDRCFEVFRGIRDNGGPDIPDEVPLAIVGNAMVSNPLRNRFDNHSHIWACDWHSTWTTKLPDGNEWKSRDWLSGDWGAMINPAIVHLMRGKALLGEKKPDQENVSFAQPRPVRIIKAQPVMPEGQPGVGDEVERILHSIGVPHETCGQCRQMINSMNLWGVEGCEQHRPEILARLRQKAADASVSERIKYAIGSVATGLWRRVSPIDPAAGILDEAIRIVRSRQPRPVNDSTRLPVAQTQEVTKPVVEDRVQKMFQEMVQELDKRGKRNCTVNNPMELRL